MKNATQVVHRSHTQFMCKRVPTIKLTGVSVWLIIIYPASILPFALIINLCYNTEPISHAQNLGFSTRLYLN